MNKTKKKTILWCIIVIVILLLALVKVPIVGTSKGYANRVVKPIATKAIIYSLNTAIDQYKVDTGIYPDPLQGLGSLIEGCDVKKWNGPYLQKKVIPKDYWENPFRYELINNIPIVTSAGLDGKFETRDDIETGQRAKLSEPVN